MPGRSATKRTRLAGNQPHGSAGRLQNLRGRVRSSRCVFCSGWYRSQHELVFVYKNGTEPYVNNVELGRHGRNRTNLWTYAGANSFGASRDVDLAMHPTVKPVQL